MQSRNKLLFCSVLLLTLALTACTSTEKGQPARDRHQSNNEPLKLNIDNSGKLNVDVNVIGQARTSVLVEEAMQDVASIYDQCEIPINTTINHIEDEVGDNLNLDQLYSNTNKYAIRRPTVFIIDSTVDKDVAFSYLPSFKFDVSGTAWITNRVSKQCFSWIVAHEIGHVLLDDRAHHPEASNVMHARCSSASNFSRAQSPPKWSVDQCERLKSTVFQ